jgi:hypothetical protein
MWLQKFPERELYLEDLASNWSYKIPFENILERLILIGIFEIKQLEIGKAISPELAQQAIRKVSFSREFFFQAVAKGCNRTGDSIYLAAPENSISKK